MKIILVSIDNSKYAANVLDCLIRIVETAAEKPEVTLFTVIEPTLPTEVLGRLGEVGEKRFKVFAESILEPATEMLKKAGVTAKAEWALGVPAEKIAAKAHEIDPSYILMGSRGLTALESLFFGSVTVGVLSRTKTPVLIVRGPLHPKSEVRKIGIAVDGSGRSGQILNYIIENRALLPGKCEFHAIYVSKSANDYMYGALGAASMATGGRSAGLAQFALLNEASGKELEQQASENVMEPLRDYFAALGGVKEVLLQGKAGDEIAKYADTEKLDLLVMGSHGRSNVEAAFAGSVVMRVAAQGTVPLFIIR
jgi:nucleotide-binding universal stress UspA family protein